MLECKLDLIGLRAAASLGLNEILSRRKCHDPERLLHSHSTSRTFSCRATLDLTRVGFGKPDALHGPSTRHWPNETNDRAKLKEQKEVYFFCSVTGESF